MKTRCSNPKSNCYTRYGGRGIRVCERWLHSFENFLADMGEKPGGEYSIDRIDSNGNYAPDNCRWATPAEQQINRRDVKLNYVSACLIRHLSNRGVLQEDMAHAFGVSRSAVDLVVRRITWRQQ